MNPETPVNKPYSLEIEPGNYSFCTCGKSEKYPICDGAHKGSGIKPERIEVTEKRRVWICGCNHSGKKPFCDGTHKTL